MKAPAFWQQRPPSPLARLLQPIGAVYGAVTLARMRRTGIRAAVPVICVGNLTAGGAGKTPVAIALARALSEAGERPVFLSRGYGGMLRIPTLIDHERHDAMTAGDEPLLLARVSPTVVAPDRAAGAALAATHGSVIVMDDGFQNPALTKDFSLVVVDAGAGFGNGLVIPAGPLRAPAPAQIAAADAMLAIGAGPGLGDALALGETAAKPVHRSDLVVDPVTAERLAGVRVLAFAGIGRPQKFFETLHGLYARIEAAQAFADHHAFTDGEAAELLATANSRQLTLVTTQKDMARLTGSPAREALARATIALPVTTPLPPQLIAAVLEKISRRS